MHSGWGVVVCISGNSGAPLSLEEAGRHIQKCAAESRCLSLQAIREMLDTVSAQNYRVLGCGMLLASVRALPSL
jgi:hypothetical protein